MRLEERLVRKGAFAFVLDGDNVRHGLCGDLGFSDAARAENIRRVGEVAALFADSGCITISAFISPSRDVREVLKERIGPDRFVEIYVSTPLSVCEERDPKGLYARARAGEIANFTGIDSEYQPPLDPALSIDSSEVDVDEACRQIEMILGQGK
jgi:adenylyl-sulfate kinase